MEEIVRSHNSNLVRRIGLTLSRTNFSSLNRFLLQFCKFGWSPLKIWSFLDVHIDQLISIAATMKNSDCSLVLNVEIISGNMLFGEMSMPSRFQHCLAKSQWRKKVLQSFLHWGVAEHTVIVFNEHVPSSQYISGTKHVFGQQPEEYFVLWLTGASPNPFEGRLFCCFRVHLFF